MPSLYLRLAVAAAALLLVAGIAAGLYHRGYVAGEAAKEAHYAPILKAAQDAATAAIARARALEGASARISADIEAHHAQTEKALADRADAARVAMLGSLRKLATLSRSCTVPGLPGSPSLAPGASPGPDRDERFTASLSRVGSQCERDSRRLAEWQEFWKRQQALAARP